MYADNTLTPKEAIRLCALGTLAAGPMTYSQLASAVRHFISRITGPSLDLMAPAMELLKFEGLVEPLRGTGMQDDALLAITDKGRDALNGLLAAKVRADANDLKKLILALKFRFLHLLPDTLQREQADLLAELCETELARLEDLRGHHAADDGFLTDWLDLEIEQLEGRLAWLNAFAAKL